LIRIRVDPRQPDRAAIARAADVLRGGGLAAIPTDTLYGLAADAFKPEAVARADLQRPTGWVVLAERHQR